MGLLSFIKEAGEKLFPHKEVEAATAQNDTDKVSQLNQAAADGITSYIATQNLTATDLKVSFDGATATATVSGVAADQETKEKIVLCCGNVTGVAKVDDQLTVAQAASKTVKSALHSAPGTMLRCFIPFLASWARISLPRRRRAATCRARRD